MLNTFVAVVCFHLLLSNLSSAQQNGGPLNAIYDKLSDELRQPFQQPNEQYDASKARLEQKVRTLSEGAQKVFFELKSAVEDESITFQQEHDPIQQIFEQIDGAAFSELQQNRIPLPGIPAPSQLAENNE